MGLRGPILLAALSLAAAAQEWPRDLPREGRDALVRDGVWVGPREFRQVPEAYKDASCTAFVTADGPIATGYRLMERTVMRMERWSFLRMPRDLRELERGLNDAGQWLDLPSATSAAALHRAGLVVGVARLLLGDAPAGLDDTTLAEARACAALVEKAEGSSMPAGFGPADPGWLGFDWRAFRPRGSYAGDESRERAFRAIRWLHGVPFRLERDEDVAALWLLHKAAMGAAFEPSPVWARGLLPVAWEASVFAEAFHDVEENEPLGPAQCRKLAESLRRGLGDRVSTDLLRETTDGRDVRLVPQVVLPENPMLFALVQPVNGEPVHIAGFPVGLAVGSALGSPPARAALAAQRDRTWLEKIDASTPALEGSNWVACAQRMRTALLDPPEPGAPQLFASAAWQRKSLRTALGSWALERNLWTLHAPEVRGVKGLTDKPPALLEPDPRVFACLAEMGRCVDAWIAGGEADGQALRVEYADAVLAEARRDVDDLLDPSGSWVSERDFLAGLKEVGVLTAEEHEAACGRIPGEYDHGVRKQWDREKNAPAPDAEIRAVRERLAPVLAACEQWHATMCDLSAAAVAPVPDGVRVGHWPVERLRPQWQRWTALCARLEALARKQLREEEWTDEDEGFLQRYGSALASTLGYSLGGEVAVDDASRSAAVVFDPVHPVMRVVGIGRPRELWVLYPYRGTKVLCRGVVLSYYEFDAKEAPTDAEWKAMLESEDRPPEPPWIMGG